VNPISHALLSDSHFRSEYRGLRNPRKAAARNVILRHAKRLFPNARLPVVARLEIQEYLNGYFGFRAPVPPQYSVPAAADRRDDSLDLDHTNHAGEDVGNQEPLVKKFIQTVTYVNGQDVSTMSNDQIANLIKQKADAIKALDDLPVKTKGIQAAIVAQKLELDQLVATLDAAFDASNGKTPA
jgi:hypothetical protein